MAVGYGQGKERIYLFFYLHSLPIVNDLELLNTNPEFLLLLKDKMDQHCSKCFGVSTHLILTITPQSTSTNSVFNIRKLRHGDSIACLRLLS